ncbi:hypothetical protein BKA56DRAFT_86367 [Ilyonectria sp. MPI-CAGE-AT-0026]|nr:hypothetical protein BKA56DRAFT_330602 [Ilyonectria sp. MPI-CAGE-AT-0026]KAH6975283.1 hypothetical protein BKA56DRAFT_86367 [Ilyonectria sp. MPI-CAGE-AT-0026]
MDLLPAPEIHGSCWASSYQVLLCSLYFVFGRRDASSRLHKSNEHITPYACTQPNVPMCYIMCCTTGIVPLQLTGGWYTEPWDWRDSNATMSPSTISTRDKWTGPRVPRHGT